MANLVEMGRVSIKTVVTQEVIFKRTRNPEVVMGKLLALVSAPVREVPVMGKQNLCRCFILLCHRFWVKRERL
jgi:hypothetical protein